MATNRRKSIQYCSRTSRNGILGASIKMCKFLFLIFVFCLLQFYAVKAELVLTFDDIECVYSSDEYIKPGGCLLMLNDGSDYGTSLSAHLEIIKKFPEGVLVQGNLKGIEMGEYTNDIGLHLESDFCELANDSHTIAAILIKSVNLNPNNCPPGPGLYGQDSFSIDGQDGLPDTFPMGKYLFNITLLTHETMILNLHIYVTVV